MPSPGCRRGWTTKKVPEAPYPERSQRLWNAEKRSGSQPSAKGPEDWFTGTVCIDVCGARAGQGGRGSVTFEPGVRTARHIHPLGEALLTIANAEQPPCRFIAGDFTARIERAT